MEAGVQVVKEREAGIVLRVVLLDHAGGKVELVTRFLSHLSDSGYSRNTVCARARPCPCRPTSPPRCESGPRHAWQHCEKMESSLILIAMRRSPPARGSHGSQKREPAQVDSARLTAMLLGRCRK
jgi:hypothetical protein